MKGILCILSYNCKKKLARVAVIAVVVLFLCFTDFIRTLGAGDFFFIVFALD